MRLEHHALGPRVHLFGLRVHEWHAGVALLFAAGVSAVVGLNGIAAAGTGAVGAWMVAKDWRDMAPGTRDTAAWRLGIHRPPGLAPVARRERVPVLAAAATAFVAAVNVVSALLPAVPGRVQALMTVAPAGELRLAHALAAPAGLALFAVGHQLARRRRWAVRVAMALLVAVGVLDILKGLDAEEAALSWSLAAILWHTRDAFWVVHGRGAREAVAVAGAAPEDWPRAAGLVRRHGSDTLAAFKLRRDLARRWSRDGHSMVGYKVQAGALLIAGDPVGPADGVRRTLTELRDHGRAHGLAVGIVGASDSVAIQAQAIGMRRMYMGDEAILPTGPMDLGGGPRKSLRKAVNRIARNGYAAELSTVAELDIATLRRLEAISERWRDGADERGFSMAADQLDDELLQDAVVVVARDETSTVRGFLHFVPVFGRPVMSLAFMRRDPDTPNGLTDFLVVEAARLLGERGCEEFSLNFCAYGRWLREPRGVEHIAARLLRVGDRWFQIERLLAFNAKFAPRWQPRYLVFDGLGRFPRVALGALLAEGQLPSIPTPRRLRPQIVAA